MRPRFPSARAAASLTAAALFLAACGLGGPPPELAAACAPPPPDPALERAIDAEGVDQWLFSEAVLRATNAARCERGLAPLAGDPALARAAAYHSGDMVTRGFLGHDSPVAGRRTPRDRVEQAGARYPRVAENIARISLYAFDDRAFVIRDQAACDFAFTPGGPPIPRRSYSAAAEWLVAGWLDSPGHRENVLDPALTHLGAGAGVAPDPRSCGELVVTQVLAG